MGKLQVVLIMTFSFLTIISVVIEAVLYEKLQNTGADLAI